MFICLLLLLLLLLILCILCFGFYRCNRISSSSSSGNFYISNITIQTNDYSYYYLPHFKILFGLLFSLLFISFSPSLLRNILLTDLLQLMFSYCLKYVRYTDLNGCISYANSPISVNVCFFVLYLFTEKMGMHSSETDQMSTVQIR